MDAIDHSNCLPAQLALDFPVLICQLIRIVKDQDCNSEADTMLLRVSPVLSFVPAKFLGSYRNGIFVYTLH
jgi:hypothetical protein